MSYIHKNLSRREFLKVASVTSSVAGGAAVPWLFNLSLAGSAAAQTASDYKALVCVMLGGGNDSFNTVLATDAASWAEYRKWRDQGKAPISLPGVGAIGGVLPIVPRTAQAGRSFALHPNMGGLASIFSQGRMAVVSNVAPIKGPIDLSNYNTGVAPMLPAALFSHSDQQAVWQAQSASGGLGWGGRMGDLLSSGNVANTIFTAISTDGASNYLAGQSTIAYAASRDGGVKIDLLSGTSTTEKARADILRRIIARDSTHLLEKETSAVTRRSLSATALLGGAVLPRGTGGVVDPGQIASVDGKNQVDNPLAVQLQTVARIIGARSTLGMKRQVFFVTLGVFDTHSDQKPQHDYAMTQVDHALSYFDAALASLQGQDVRNQVTLFTASDFGRTFTSNGTGTDHGFGAHHMVMGGAVRGKDIYGSFPQSGTGHERDMGKGILIPQYSVDQYGATLARWFGVSDSQLGEVFPYLSRFSQTNLGFMG
jgi:uncharacterized protein (DUF1501 family)